MGNKTIHLKDGHSDQIGREWGSTTTHLCPENIQTQVLLLQSELGWNSELR